MAVYAIGDIQGCFDELGELLEKLRFDPARDTAWFVGDLVNRGPKSLETLRFVRNLGDRAVTVLGNHDLHLLALAAGNRKHAGEDSLEDILAAPDAPELLAWLRQQPLLHHDRKLNFTMIHAGLPPDWDLAGARARAAEVEAVLRGPSHVDYFMQMYGNQPQQWSPDLEGIDRLRFITNCFTRLRYCDAAGQLYLKEKGAPGSQAPGLVPWFEHPARLTRPDRVLFGHWSTLGYRNTEHVWALDTGCLWGGQLTALRIDTPEPEPFFHACKAQQDPARFT